MLHLRTDLSTRHRAASEECWKKNNLERNAEVGLMIENTTKCFFDHARHRFGIPGR